jgi:protein-S-isoprenylcysteine O-methyltransferase Ste14
MTTAVGTTMTIYSWLVVVCWAAFLGYWLVTGLSSKRTAKSYGRQMLIRAIIVAVVLLFVRSRPADIGTRAIILSPAVRTLGVLVCAAGVSFAIWARRRLGKNWGMPMSVHESPELITAGPYARLRHPIYTGIIIALIGNALALSLWWLVAVFAALLRFGYAARKEEETLLTTFPREYAAYQRRTSMIVPGLF